MPEAANSKTSSLIEAAKSIGGTILGIAVIVGLIFLGTILIKGGISLADKIFPFLVKATNFLTIILILILVPMSFFRKSRMYSGLGMYFSSYLFGFSMWIYSALIAYILWGLIALFIGLFLMGIGVLPIALLASLFHGEWTIFGNLVYMAILTYGSRMAGMKIAEKAERDSYQENSSEFYIENNERDYMDENITEAEIIEKTDNIYCSNCGKQILTQGNFCRYCGNKLN